MWLATKFSAEVKLPDLAMAISELGGPSEASNYRKLFERYPRVKRGPDEDMSSHFSRLKREDAAWRARDTTEVDRRAQDPRAHVQEDSNAKAPAWFSTPSAPSPASLGLPQRIPGLTTGDSWAHTVPSEWIPRPLGLPQRAPGMHYVDPATKAALPGSLPTHEEWLRGLADKGIFLDSDGRRQTPYRPMRGHDIWEEFTRPAAGRHRASKTVVAYVRKVLADDDDAIARWQRRHKAMTDAGWDFHESGSGNYYEKRIGGGRHRIMGDTMNGKHGWTHQDESGRQFFYDNIRDALLHAHRGQGQATFKPPPPPDPNVDHHRLSSWSD